MKLSIIALYVKDYEKSLYFYNTLLGLPVSHRQPGHGGTELVFLGEKGNVSIELIPIPPESYTGFSLGFDVENLAEAKKHLTENGYPVEDEMAINPQTTICFLDGPNGEKIELIERK